MFRLTIRRTLKQQLERLLRPRSGRDESVLNVSGVEDLTSADDAFAEGADDVFAALGEGEVRLAGLREGEQGRKREESEKEGRKEGQETDVLTAERPLRLSMSHDEHSGQTVLRRGRRHGLRLNLGEGMSGKAVGSK